MRYEAVDRITHDVDKLSVWQECMHAFGNIFDRREIRVAGGRFADCCMVRSCEMTLIPVDSLLPVFLIGKEIDFLDIRHENVGMSLEVFV